MGWRFVPAGEFGVYRQQWDQLNHELGHAHPLFDSRFVHPLVMYYGTESDWLAIEETVEGVVSMLLLRRESGGVWSTFRPPPAQVSPMLVRGIDSFESLLDCLPFPAVRLDVLAQDPLFCPEWIFDWPFAEKKCHAVTMAVVAGESFATYWGKRSRKLRNNAKRWAKRIRSSNMAPHIRKVTEHDAMEGALGRYADIESRGWKGREGSAIDVSAEQGRFFRDVLYGFGEVGQACAYELYLDDQCVASRLMLRTNDMDVALKTTYDENFSEFAVGRILLWSLIEDVLSESADKRLEFYTNASADQLAWASETRSIYHVSAYASRKIQMLVGGYRVLRRAVTRR